jgi:hypothetical protein
MKPHKVTIVSVTLFVSVLAVAPAAPPDDPGPFSSQVTWSEPLRAEVQRQVDTLARSINENDVSGLSDVLSSEVFARIDDELDLQAFLAEHRAAIARTFSLGEGERVTFEVVEALPQGDAVRVTLRFRGEDLRKPFYFVRENGTLLMNFGPPGFSKVPPKGVLFGRNSYQVKNVNIVPNPTITMSCYQGSGRPDSTVMVAPGSTKTLGCQDSCGRWWSGSSFRVAGSEGPTKKCDWNWWGVDVIINLLDAGGFHCNDNC